MNARLVGCFSLLLLSCAFLRTGPAQAASLVWSTSREQARASALSQGKLILLLAGRPTCDDCTYMKYQACEAANVRPVIDEVYVPWFANIDYSTEWQRYAVNLGNFALPLICMIDPATTNTWLFRQTGLCTSSTLESRLRQAARACPPKPNNLVHQQVIRDSHYQVTGHIWTNAQPANVFDRVNPGTATVYPFVNATGTTDWIAGVDSYVVAGVSNQYSFDVYAEFINGSRSPTNRLMFTYVPTARPHIAFIGVSNGVVRMTLTNLTVGSMVYVERCLDLGSTNEWTLVTSFVAAASTCQVSEGVSPSWSRAFYRVVGTP